MAVQTSETESRLTAKGRAMRDRIVESAAELVFAGGARETTLDDVRSAVGASKSLLYHYFADKDELLRAVIDFQERGSSARSSPSLPPSTRSRRSDAGGTSWSSSAMRLARSEDVRSDHWSTSSAVIRKTIGALSRCISITGLRRSSRV